jgi:hypothetical protein
MGLQCRTLLILKQLHNASYKVSGMGNGYHILVVGVLFVVSVASVLL